MTEKLSDQQMRIILIILAVTAGCLVVLAIGLIVRFFFIQPKAAPTPTFTSVPTFTPTPTTAQVTDETWARIQNNGKMVVGTSADYPPFSYYTPEFLLDGYDVALIREIGQRLGLGVEIKDMAFDGLGNALQLGQIDIAIAALSVTPEREAIFDFTNTYFVSEDATLAQQESSIGAISSLDEMANWKVGVQRASIYENWLRTNLVDTGKMPPANLFSFIDAGQAVAELKGGRIDLVVMDLQPANLAVQSGGVKLVGQGLYRQLFAIAMPAGAASLQAELNQALTQMQDEGRLSQLAEFYLGLTIDEILPPPTPTPGPTQTPPPPPPCIDGMERVMDLNLDDDDMANPPEVLPGQPFNKGWRVRNIGTCTWNPSYHLVYVGGNVPGARMGGEQVGIAGLVAPGQEYDIWVDLVAPIIPGVYQGLWQMTNTEAVAFGERIWVGVKVPVGPEPTPEPTQTPSPNISFSADRTSISAGEPVLFTWGVENAQEVYFYAQGDPWEASRVPPQGSRTVYPAQNTVYELRVISNDGTVEVRQIRIEVTPIPGAPAITLFTVEPPFQITLGQCVDIRWDVQGDVSAVKITSNGVLLWDNAPIGGAIQDCPAQAGETTYAIEASGPGGTSRLQHVLNVIQSEEPPPTEEPIAPPIVDTAWRMTSYFDGATMVSTIQGTEVTALFSSDGNLTGSAGCNIYETSYQAGESTLTIGPASLGQQVCAEPVGIMDQESAYLAALSSVASYQIAGSNLEVFDATGQTVVTFTVQ